jgi:hypothetical protein
MEPGDEVERARVALKLFGALASVMVRIICLDLVSAKEGTTRYDLFVLMLIFPVNENSALSAVQLL